MVPQYNSMNGGGRDDGAVVITPPTGVDGDQSTTLSNFNILSQVTSTSQLDPNNISFDPNIVGGDNINIGGLSNDSPNIVNGLTTATQMSMMTPSFLQQPSLATATSSTVTTSSQHQPSPPATGILTSQSSQPIQYITANSQTSTTTHQFQQLDLNNNNTSQAVSVSTMGDSLTTTSTANSSSLANAVMTIQQSQQQQQPQLLQHQPQQRVVHHQMQTPQQNHSQQLQIQQLQQQYKPQNTNMNGRVPATKRDGRKLFVGGLPNEGELLLLSISRIPLGLKLMVISYFSFYSYGSILLTILSTVW